MTVIEIKSRIRSMIETIIVDGVYDYVSSRSDFEKNYGWGE